MSDEPVNPHGQPPRSPRWHESAERFLTQNFWRLVGIALIGAAVLLYFDVQLPTEPPRWAHTVFWTAVLGSPLAYVLASKTVEMLFDPYGVILLDIDARDKDVAIYNIPEKRWQEVTVTDGDVMRLEAAQTVYSGRNFDPEELTVEGTWRGSMNDYELLQEQAKITQLRGRLTNQAKRGFAIETHAWMVVRSAVQDAVRSVTKTFEAGTLPEGGDSINRAIEAAIDGFDFDNLSEAEPDDEPEEVTELLENAPDPTGAVADD